MKILVREKISPHRMKTPEGYLVCSDVILARTGIQQYKKCELFADADNTVIDVDREESEVFNETTLASFENKPLTIQHPDEDVTVENHKELAYGYVRDIRKGYDAGSPVMRANIVITDKEAIEAVENGMQELSCGYDCDIVEENGKYYQRNIRGNHVALCECGRAGNARIIDSLKDRSIPSGYKNFGGKYAWEFEGRAKTSKEAIEKVLRKFPELNRDWGLDELLDYMVKHNQDNMHESDWSINFDTPEDNEGHFYFSLTEKKERYNDSVEDAPDTDSKSGKKQIALQILMASLSGLDPHMWNMTGNKVNIDNNSITLVYTENGVEWRNFKNGQGKIFTNENDLKSAIRERITNKMKDGQIEEKLKAEVKRRFEEEKHSSDKSAKITENGFAFEIVRENGKKLTYRAGEGFVFDSCEDALVDPSSEDISKFEDLLRRNEIKIERKGKTWSGRIHYQVLYNGSDKELFQKLNLIDDQMERIGIPTTYSVGYNPQTKQASAGIDLDKKSVKDSCEDADTYIVPNWVKSLYAEAKAKTGTKDIIKLAGYIWEKGMVDPRFDYSDLKRLLVMEAKNRGDIKDSCEEKIEDASEPKLKWFEIEFSENKDLAKLRGKKFAESDLAAFNKEAIKAAMNFSGPGYDKVYVDFFFEIDGHTYKYHGFRADLTSDVQSALLSKNDIATAASNVKRAYEGGNKWGFTKIDSVDPEEKKYTVETKDSSGNTHIFKVFANSAKDAIMKIRKFAK